MKLHRAHFRNFCQFEDFEIEFGTGLTAVVGRNGSGKSNSLKGIYGAVTGDFTRNDGPRTDNICWTASSNGDPSFVDLDFSHNNHQLSIHRGLKPNSCWLKIDGEEMTRKATEAEQLLYATLETTKSVISDYVFVDQWAMFSFLSTTDAKRIATFQKLFRLDKFEQCWNVLQVTINNHPVEGPSVVQLDEMQSEANRLTLELGTLKADSQRIQEEAGIARDYDPAKDSLNTVLEAYHTVRRLRGEREQLVNNTLKLADVLADYRKDEQRFRPELEALEEEEAELQRQIAEQNAADKLWTQFDAHEAAISKAETLVTTTNTSLVNIQKAIPIKPSVEGTEESLEEVRDSLTSSVAVDEAMVNSFDPARGLAECPTCHTPVENLGDQLEQARQRLPELRRQLSEVKQNLQLLQNYRSDRQIYDSDVASLTQRLTKAREDLSALQGGRLPRPDCPRPTADADIPQRRSLSAEIKELRERVHNVDTSIKLQEQKVEHANERLRAIDQELSVWSPACPTAEEATRVQSELTAKREALTTLRECEKALVAKESEYEVYARQIASLKDELARTERSREAVKVLNNVRELMHRDAVPRMVSHTFLEMMEDRINTLLEDFDSPFRVNATEDISFDARFASGKVMPAARLSGGEKTLLALAFRVVVNSLFAGELGLLVLDEPTAGLDEQNIRCIETALSRLREISQSEGLQCLVVTHESSIDHLFDRVITL